jgi:hypothetical protein
VATGDPFEMEQCIRRADLCQPRDLGLGKDAPLGRHIERSGTIIVTPILSGLHHRYARI